MRIRYRPPFNPDKPLEGYEPLQEWFHLMLREIPKGDDNYGGGIYTDRLYDLVLLGRAVAEGRICPINLPVQINNLDYFFDMQGDLHLSSWSENAPKTIPLSQFKESR